MADKISGENVGRDDLTDTGLPAADPFAELTRIMGFDPRKAEDTADVYEQSVVGDDFSIDLEEELMLELEEGDHVAEASAPASEAPSFDEPLPEFPVQAEAQVEQAPEQYESSYDAAYGEYADHGGFEAAAGDAVAHEMNDGSAADEDVLDEPLPVIKLSPIAAEPQPVVEYEPEASSDDAALLDVADLEAEFNALLGGSDDAGLADSEPVADRPVQIHDEQPHFEDYQLDVAADAAAQPVDEETVDFHFDEPVDAQEPALTVAYDDGQAQPEGFETQPVVADVAAMAEVQPEAAADQVPSVELEEPLVVVKVDEKEAPVDDDPFAMLAAMAQKYRTTEPGSSWRSSLSHITRATPQVNRVVAAPVVPAAVASAPVEPVFEQQAEPVQAHTTHVEPESAPVEQQSYVPEIETVEVIDKPVILANDLDIPDVIVPEEPPVVAPVDDLDAEFNNLLKQMSAPSAPVAPLHERTVSHAPVETSRPATIEPAASAQTAYAHYQGEVRASQPVPAAQPATYQPQSYQPQSYSAQPAAPAPAYNETAYRQPVQQTAVDEDIQLDLTEDDLADAFDGLDVASIGDIDLDSDLDGGFDDDVAPMAYQSQQQPKRRGLLIAAIVGGVAILAVAGAVAMSLMGDAQGSAPELVKADQAPFKVRPENPGGTVAPNQDSKVYETIGRNDAAGGVNQERLVSNEEEPVDLPDQLPLNGDDDLAMVDDGSAKSEERITPSMADQNGNDGETIAIAPRKVRTMVVRPDGTLVPREETVPQKSSEAVEPQSDTTTVNSIAAAIEGGQDDAAEIQPGVTSEQTASIEPQPAVTSEWMMQIASETSEAAANNTYQKMLGRYGKVLDGKGVNIVKAEVAGKGTFWRIRIPASTREDAAGMCDRLKSAGGKCFVTKS